MKLGLFTFLFIFSINLFPANVFCGQGDPLKGSKFGQVEHCVRYLKELEPKLPKWLVAWLAQPGDIPLTPVFYSHIIMNDLDGIKKIVNILRARSELREFGVATSSSNPREFSFEKTKGKNLYSSNAFYSRQEAFLYKSYIRMLAKSVCGGDAIVIHLPTYLKNWRDNSHLPTVDLTSDLLPLPNTSLGIDGIYVSNLRRLKYRSVTPNSRTRISGDEYDSVEITLLDGTKIRAKASEAGGDNPDPIFYDWYSSP